jgi:pimeloyl-ACP methyl ester carboxylesterase
MKKEVKTSLLNISYEEKGNENSPVIVFVHGFPDDAQTWNVVTSDFIKDGYRTLSPYLRGYGSTRFHSEITMRSAQYMALVTDLADFVNALRLEQFLLVGHDWGSTVAHQFAALFPQRVRGLVALGCLLGESGFCRYCHSFLQASLEECNRR